MTTQNIIISCVTFLIGIALGWVSARLKTKTKIIESQDKVESQAEKISELNVVVEKLSSNMELIRNESQGHANEAARLESGLEAADKRIFELQNDNMKALASNRITDQELTSTKELYAALRTKSEKQTIDQIEVTNERNRLKDQVESYRLKEIELSKANSGLSAKYEEAVKSMEEQKKFIDFTQVKMKDSFNSLSAEALDKNNHSFLDLAKTALESHVTEAKGDLEKRQQAIDSMVKPLGESLSKMDEKINSLENKREGAYGNISALLDQVKLTNMALDKETRNLVTALKTSHTRGKYGEIALRRLVEFAGMTDQCDFMEQKSTETENGRLIPDMIIKLPENRQVVVDSKVPLSAYLKIFETDDNEQQKLFLIQHVAATKAHVRQLSAKAYWEQFPSAPDFVVLFMQIESSFGAALQAWPEMIEEALSNRIIVATPTTLITILRTIGYSWNQLKTMENIDEIREAAVELYERSSVLMGHMSSVGASITNSVNHYNKAVGSLEGSFFPQGRKIQSLSQAYTKKDIKELELIEVSVRPIIGRGPDSEENKIEH